MSFESFGNNHESQAEKIELLKADFFAQVAGMATEESGGNSPLSPEDLDALSEGRPIPPNEHAERVFDELVKEIYSDLPEDAIKEVKISIFSGKETNPFSSLSSAA